MRYSSLVRKLLTRRQGAPTSLTGLLGLIDAYNKSVPSLNELNETTAELREQGVRVDSILLNVTKQEYDAARRENRDMMRRELEKRFTPETLEKAMETYLEAWCKALEKKGFSTEEIDTAKQSHLKKMSAK